MKGMNGKAKKAAEDSPEFMDMAMPMGESKAMPFKKKKYYPTISLRKAMPGMKMGEKRMMMMQVKMVGSRQRDGEAPEFDLEIHKAKMHG
jgi:hypothetical protein